MKPALHHMVPQPSKQETRPAFRNSCSRALSETPREGGTWCGFPGHGDHTTENISCRIPSCRNEEVLQDRNVLGI